MAPQAAEPSGYWLSDLPDDTPVAELVRLARIRWRIEHDYPFCTMIRTEPKVPAPG